MMATRNDIARWLAEEPGMTSVEASPSRGERGPLLTRVSGLEEADAAAVVFAAAQPVLDEALRSQAGLILAGAGLTVPEKQTWRVIFVRDARLAFAIVSTRMRPVPTGGVDASALVDGAAVLAEDVCIGPGTIVAAGVHIGAGSVLGARVVVAPGVVLGRRVLVQAGAVLGSQGFGYACRPDGSYVLFPQQGRLVIEDDVEIGANATIDRGALGETRIGAGTKIDNLVHIGHNCRIGRNVIIAAQTGISGSTVVEDGAVLGGQVGIGEHALVGTGVILGGGAGVLTGKKLRGPGQVFWGRPAQPLKQYLRDLARLRKGG